MKIRFNFAIAVFFLCMFAVAPYLIAHQITFNSSMTYSDTQPTGGIDSVANWTGATFDAANIGGSGVNADGGANIYNGVQGLEDLCGLADQWLMTGCTDIPACNGADLDNFNDVTLSDFSILAHNFLVPEDLQLHLRFDEMTGAVASDSSIYWRDGSLVNSPVWSAGYDGGALTFNGSNYVEIADDTGLNPDTGSWSVTFWMKSDPPIQGALIVSKRQSTSPYPGYLIGLSNGTPTTFSAGSKLTFLIGAASGDRKGGYTTNDIIFNEWTHVCVVLDQDADTAYIYINGVPVPIIRTPNDTLPAINTTTPVYIGKNPGVSTKPYYGLVDDVRIYNRPLSEAEI